MINPYQHVPPLVIPEGHFTVGQVASILGVSERYVRTLINSGKISDCRMPGVYRRRLVKRASLERYARNHGIELDASKLE